MSAVDDQRPRAPVPARLSLAGLREAVQTCRACELWADATQALLGPAVRIGRDRGRGQPSELAALVTVTAHPASILRARGEDERRQAMDAFVSDLEQVSQWLDQR